MSPPAAAPAVHPPATGAVPMVGARLFNMALGLLALPVLIRFLGGEGFAAWALLLALSVGFALLELGMPAALVRCAAVALREGRGRELGRIVGQAWLVLAAAFGIGALLLWGGAAAALVRWLGLPSGPGFTPVQLVLGVFGAVAARAFLQPGMLVLVARRRFRAAATVALLQSGVSNVLAMLLAWQTGRLDLTLLGYWGGQLAVVGGTFAALRADALPRFGGGAVGNGWRDLCRFGLSGQMEAWAQFVTFQFDKFLVAGWVGLWAVAPYEVANRAAAALRSVPASAADGLLATSAAAAPGARQAWDAYLAGTRLAAYGVLLFLLLPLAVSPVFLYAWAGEMGQYGRTAFALLALGAGANVLALPAAVLAQAVDRPGLQARAATAAMLSNVPLSGVLVLQWGLSGAGLGTAIAMGIGAAVLIVSVHRAQRQPLAPLLRLAWSFWPPVLLCLVVALAARVSFDLWFATLETATRYSRFTRIAPAVLAAAGYALGVAALVWLEWRRGTLRASERAWLRTVWLRLRGR